MTARFADAVAEAPVGPEVQLDPSTGRGEERDAAMQAPTLRAPLPSRPMRAAANDAAAGHGVPSDGDTDDVTYDGTWIVRGADHE